jgi:type II secretory pathway pseudopilin PulG
MKKLPKNSGQALLIVLLIMAVALTVGLAVTSRTVTDIEISEQTEEASRAFSAAEAGIEEALVGVGTAFGGEFEEGEVKYATQKDFLGTSNQYLLPEASREDEVRTLWLAEYPDTQNYTGDSLILYWGNADSTDEPALEATVYYKTGGNYKVIRYALDPISRTPDNSFCQPEEIGEESCELVSAFEKEGNYPIEGKTARYKATLDLSPASAGILLFARLRLLYTDESDQVLGAETEAASLNFPSQGVKISSVGTAGGSTRKVEVVRMHPAPPGIFDFLLYSESGLDK